MGLRTSRKRINASINQGGNFKRRYVFLDSLGNFLANVSDPRDWDVVFVDPIKQKRVVVDGQSFKSLYPESYFPAPAGSAPNPFRRNESEAH